QKTERVANARPHPNLARQPVACKCALRDQCGVCSSNPQPNDGPERLCWQGALRVWNSLGCIQELLDGRSARFNPQNCPCVLARASSQPMPSGFLCCRGLKSALHRQLVDAGNRLIALCLKQRADHFFSRNSSNQFSTT